MRRAGYEAVMALACRVQVQTQERCPGVEGPRSNSTSVQFPDHKRR